MTITTKQIEDFETTAGQAGDLVACAVCQIATRGEADPETLAAMGEDGRWRLEQLDLDASQDRARALVAGWIADAEAQ